MKGTSSILRAQRAGEMSAVVARFSREAPWGSAHLSSSSGRRRLMASASRGAAALGNDVSSPRSSNDFSSLYLKDRNQAERHVHRVAGQPAHNNARSKRSLRRRGPTKSFADEETPAWVPIAFRGAVSADDDKSKKKRSFQQQGRTSRTGGGRGHVPQKSPEEKQKSAEDYVSRKMKQRLEKNVTLVNKQCFRLARTAAVYKRRLLKYTSSTRAELLVLPLADGAPTDDVSFKDYQKLLSELTGFLHHHYEPKPESVFGLTTKAENVFDLPPLPPAHKADLRTKKADKTKDKVIQLNSMDGIVKTEKVFREMCVLLREIAMASAEAADWNADMPDEKPKEEVFLPFDLSVLSLEALNQIRRDREELVNAALSLPPKVPPKAVLEDKKPSSWFDSVKRTVDAVLKPVMGEKAEPNTLKMPSVSDMTASDMVHNNQELGVTLDLYEKILEHFMTPPTVTSNLDTIKTPNFKAGKPNHAEARGQPSNIPNSVCREIAPRLVAVLREMDGQSASNERKSPILSLQPRQRLNILAFLCRAGTLESAETAYRVLQAFSERRQRNTDMLVWRAYWEVAKNRSIPMEEREEAVRQFYRIWLHHINIGKGSGDFEEMELTLMVLAAIAEVGEDELDEQFKSFSENILLLSLGKSDSKRFNSGLKKGYVIFKGLGLKKMTLIDSYTRVQACSDLSKTHLLISWMLRQSNEQFPSVASIKSYVKGVSRHYGEVGVEDSGRNSTDDVDFALTLLESAMSRRESDSWPDQETFEICSNLITITNPPNTGECFLKWFAHLETRACFDDNVSIRYSDYNRVLWGIWQQLKKEPTEQHDHNFCEEAWRILDKMDSKSMPLLMSEKDFRRKSEWKHLYQLDAVPQKRTYELVLNCCESTQSHSEFANAFEIVQKVIELAEKRNVELDTALVERCLSICQGRLDGPNPELIA